MRTLLAALTLAITACTGAAQAAEIGGSATICRKAPSTRSAVIERLAARTAVDVLGSTRG